MEEERFDALILSGGAGQRLGGVDKGDVVVGDSTLLARVLAATQGASRVVCVGPQRETTVPVVWTMEEPPGGGPAAGMGAGMELVVSPLVVVLAVDVPFVTRDVVSRLLARCDRDAAMVVDGNGRAQPLIAVYRSDALRKRLDEIGDLSGTSMQQVLDGLTCSLMEDRDVAIDIDTQNDLERAREQARSHMGGDG